MVLVQTLRSSSKRGASTAPSPFHACVSLSRMVAALSSIFYRSYGAQKEHADEQRYC